MAQFKYVGHEQGLTPLSSGKILLRGKKKSFAGGGEDNSFEMEVVPGEVFEIPDAWDLAVQAVAGTKNPLDPSKKQYQRIN